MHRRYQESTNHTKKIEDIIIFIKNKVFTKGSKTILQGSNNTFK